MQITGRLDLFAGLIAGGMAARGEFHPELAWELAKRLQAARPATPPLYPPNNDDAKGATP